MTDIRQAKPYALFLHALGWETERHSRGYSAAIKPLLPLFGILKLQRVTLESIDFAWLKALARHHLVFVSYIELADRLVVSVHTPYDQQAVTSYFESVTRTLQVHGYVPVSHGMLPSKTQVINLTQSMEKILGDMKPKTRYNIGLAQRKKVALSVISAHEFLTNQALIEEVNALLQQNARRAGYWVEGKSWIQKKLKAFDTQAFVVMARSSHTSRELLAVALFLYSQDTLFYWVNGSTSSGRKMFAPSLIIHEALKIGRERGLKEFDFDGVFDERFPNKRWLGYTHFKKGFGGSYVYYAPCFVKRLAFIR